MIINGILKHYQEEHRKDRNEEAQRTITDLARLHGWTLETIFSICKECKFSNHPQLKKEDIVTVLKYATEILKEEKVYPLP